MARTIDWAASDFDSQAYKMDSSAWWSRPTMGHLPRTEYARMGRIVLSFKNAQAAIFQIRPEAFPNTLLSTISSVPARRTEARSRVLLPLNQPSD